MRCWVGMMLAVIGGSALAVEDLQVLGLFRDRVMVEMDGQRQFLRVGRPAVKGVRLLEADSEGALLEVDGVARRLRLGRRISGNYRPPAPPELRVWRDARGMFATRGSINGGAVDFIVDTGASQVALSGDLAERLGIDFKGRGKPFRVHTAAGDRLAHRLPLAQVKVGNILLRNVDAMVLEGSSPRQVLLGMSFLGRLKMEQSGSELILRAAP